MIYIKVFNIPLLKAQLSFNCSSSTIANYGNYNYKEKKAKKGWTKFTIFLDFFFNKLYLSERSGVLPLKRWLHANS